MEKKGLELISLNLSSQKSIQFSNGKNRQKKVETCAVYFTVIYSKTSTLEQIITIVI